MGTYTEDDAVPARINGTLIVGIDDANGKFKAIRVDEDGKLITNATGGGSGGTEYAEDAVATANPIGGMMMAVANDTLANEVASGNNVAPRATRKGELYTKDSDIATKLDTIKTVLDAVKAAVEAMQTDTPDLGQAVAASSIPVVLPAAQITTLTPPAAITGFATSTKQDAAQTTLTSIDGKLTAPALGATENHVGVVTGKSAILDFTLTLDTSAYISGDVLADTQSLANAFRVNDGIGVAYSLVLNDKDDQGQALDLYFLSANVSLGTENSTPSITDANANSILGFVSISTSDWQDLGGARIAFIPANRMGLGLKAASGTTTLYIAAICRSGTPTYTANGITGRLMIVQD